VLNAPLVTHRTQLPTSTFNLLKIGGTPEEEEEEEDLLVHLFTAPLLLLSLS